MRKLILLTFSMLLLSIGGSTVHGQQTIPLNVIAVCNPYTSLNRLTVAQVATGGGSSLASVTSCIAGKIYISNITNSAVTMRLQDKTGSPIIWLGGNNDFSIPPNSNLGLDMTGLTFVNGITAIAGTSSALNLFIPALQ